jgi:hypothetical protein
MPLLTNGEAQAVLERIHRIINGPRWSIDTTDHIAEVLRSVGFQIDPAPYVETHKDNAP